MKKVLVTGGPVHAYLDSVKIITNRFKGGLMVDLVEDLLDYDTEVTYVCPVDGDVKKPNWHSRLTVRGHKGFEDYTRIVLELAPEMDAVVLGAAVANLIPANPYKGKFPSHNYKPGDIIPINFTIAPRIIDQVKKVAPKTHLFGFKLLSQVGHEEIIRAAYEVVLNSGATAVFANDLVDLKQKYAVTKERGVHPMRQENMAAWILEIVSDEYYRTSILKNVSISDQDLVKIKRLINIFSSRFVTVEHGIVFGTIAVRSETGFLTTGRGKRELDDIVRVEACNHLTREILAGPRKASLNAPLLAKIFENPSVEYVVHYHEQEPGLPTHSYAPPGTVRDTNRLNGTSFNIREHGCMLLFDKNGQRL